MESIDKEVYKLVKKSKLVNGKWYLESYPDVAALGMDPIKHYLKYGWRMHRNPCKRFDTSFYIENYRNKMAEYKNPLLHYIVHGKKLGFSIKPNESKNLISSLSHSLWGGYSKPALKELEEIYSSSSNNANQRWLAAWHSARWYYFCGSYEKAYELAVFLFSLPSRYINLKECYYLKSFCEMRFGKWEQARKTLRGYLSLNPDDADAYFALSNTYKENPEIRIGCINKAYHANDFSGIKLKEPSRGITIGNIEAEKKLSRFDGKEKISIIMPIFNAGEKIRIAINSLLEQTYRNIEIVAVDDCSTDDTMDIIKEISKQDSRVIPVQPPCNGGAYAARNYGLKFATGDLLTTHDSDDWSHPEKLKTQVDYLNNNQEVMGCSTHWIRAREDLEFTQNWRPNNSLTHWSQSSFMFRRQVLDAIGVWDNVRIGGDTEYIWRMQAHYGKHSLAKILPEIPLAFALDAESSLTRTKSTHVRTVYYGLRHIYRQIKSAQHKEERLSNTLIDNDKEAFSIPRLMVSSSTTPLEYDIFISCDFSRKEHCNLASEILLRTDLDKYKVCLFHWPIFKKGTEQLDEEYFQLLKVHNVEPVVPGQTVSCQLEVIGSRELLNYQLDTKPSFVAEHHRIVADEVDELLHAVDGFLEKNEYH
nr:glycosyltransferase [uncultured Halomonas sp.]